MKSSNRIVWHCLLAAAVLLAVTQPARADNALDQPAPQITAPENSDEPSSLEQLLPPSVQQNLDIMSWGWLEYLSNQGKYYGRYWTSDLALGATERVGDDLAFTVDVHYTADAYWSEFFFEQAFGTVKLSDDLGTLLTVGKFNANFGIEARNAWDRLDGTTSLLFGAQPQDLVGAMFTQPIGDSGFTVRPFLATDFEGHAEFNQPVNLGLTAIFHRTDDFSVSWTNWFGTGLEKYPAEYYAKNAYDLDNWWGPAFVSVENDGLLYFTDANVTWKPAPDWTLAAEGLLASDGDTPHQLAWDGFQVMGNWDLSDQWRLFGRWSYLNDAMGIITGIAETRQELSGGVGFEVMHGVELRGEYRHDFAATGDLDNLSVHLTFSY